MKRTGSVIVAVIAVTFAASSGGAQQMRRSAPDGAAGPPGEVPKGIPRNARHPYAGVWDGTFGLTRGPGSDERRIPIVMLVSVTDSAKGDYAGATILPNGARAPHLETTVVDGEMRWKQENSGGGFWMYAGKLVGRDSIAGTVFLKDWPQLPPGDKPPAGTFALVRRAPGK